MKAQRRALEEAHAQFNNADSEALRLKRRVDEIGTKLSHARAARGRLETDVATFATSDEPLDALAGRAKSAARDAVIARAETDGEIMFLESALAQATDAWNRVRGRIVMCERAVVTAHRALADADIDECLTELWRNNRKLLKRLREAVYTASWLSGADQPGMAPLLAIHRIDDVLDGTVSPHLKQFAQNDPTFYDGAVDPATLLAKSAQLSSEERGRLPYHLTEAEIVEVLSTVVAPPAAAPFDAMRAREQVQWLTTRIESKRATLDSIAKKTWYGRRIDDKQLAAELEQLTEQRDRWTASISEHAKAA